jgi:hypothetical protein
LRLEFSGGFGIIAIKLHRIIPEMLFRLRNDRERNCPDAAKFHFRFA